MTFWHERELTGPLRRSGIIAQTKGCRARKRAFSGSWLIPEETHGSSEKETCNHHLNNQRGLCPHSKTANTVPAAFGRFGAR